MPVEAFFKNLAEIRQLYNEKHNIGINNRFLWKYIFHLQDSLLSSHEKYTNLRKDIEYKDRLIHEITVKLERANTDTEVKHIENLILTQNPRKMIDKIKNTRSSLKIDTDELDKKQEKVPADEANENNVKHDTLRKNYNSTPSNHKNVTTNKFFSGLETCSSIKLPLCDASINRSFEHTDADLFQNYNSLKMDREGVFSPLSYGYPLNTSLGEEEITFSNPENLRAYLGNIHETLKAMKENSFIVQSENNKLKEIVKLLRNKILTLERERENFLISGL